MDSEDVAKKMQDRNLLRRARLRSNYRAVFESDAGMRVMVDLFQFCVMANAGIINREAALHTQGRTIVFKRICKMLNMKDEELMRLMREDQ